MTKGIIYYTDNRLGGPIFPAVQKLISQSGLTIVSVSLKPIDFGKNIVLNLSPGFLTMNRQIAAALQASQDDYVFFCEHDVLYPPSHFEFTPPEDDVFYYNAHIWRWKHPSPLAITYDRLICLSGLCVNRKFALDHYRRRIEKIQAMGWETDRRHEPIWARRWGYEPGTKTTRRGGFSNDTFATWQSKVPLIDIRHGKTFSPTKVTLDSFKHLPTGWRETPIAKIAGWDLKELFRL